VPKVTENVTENEHKPNFRVTRKFSWGDRKVTRKQGQVDRKGAKVDRKRAQSEKPVVYDKGSLRSLELFFLP
jgi:hypothetical protein